MKYEYVFGAWAMPKVTSTLPTEKVTKFHVKDKKEFHNRNSFEVTIAHGLPLKPDMIATIIIVDEHLSLIGQSMMGCY